MGDIGPQAQDVSILGKPVPVETPTGFASGDVAGTNFAMLVIQAIAYIGIERFMNSLSDLGNFQSSIAVGQTAVSNMQKAMALLEQNAVWNNKSGKAFVSKDFWSKNSSTMSNMLKSIYQVFSNMGSKNSSDQTPKYGDIEIALPKPHGGYVLVKPYDETKDPKTGKVTYTVNKEGFKIVNDFINKLNSYMMKGTSSNLIPTLPENPAAAGNHMPVFQAMALAELQVDVDKSSTYYVGADGKFTPEFQNQVNNGTFAANIMGSFEGDPMMSTLFGLANVLDQTNSDSRFGHNGTMMDYIISHGKSSTLDVNKGFQIVLMDAIADNLKKQYSSTPSKVPMPPDPDKANEGKTGKTSVSGWWSNMSEGLGRSASFFQSQTQEVSATSQKDTTQITSYQSMGQNIVSSWDKAAKTMVDQQKSN